VASTLQTITEQARSILLGISAYARPRASQSASQEIDDPQVIQMRENLGGQLVPPPQSQTRWYMSDVENAEHLADIGNLTAAGRLMFAARKDGQLAGVLSTRTGGLVRLPKRFRGDPDVVSALEFGHDDVRSVFDEMFPPSELALLAADGLLLGVGIAELVAVEGRDYPVMIRLDPMYLNYQWYENTWYYNATVGRLRVTPGDGHWILHAPGGRIAPWQAGLWRAVGRAYVRKEHAAMHRDNWEAKLANPARVAVAPQGAAEPQKQAFFQQLMAWGVNTVFGITPGYDVKLVESNGRGWESFNETIAQQNTEYVIAIAGQTVTTDGGAGFANADIHKTIRSDLIKDTGDGLSYTINTQGIPVFVAQRWGADAILQKPCAYEYDVTPPKDRNSEATALVQVATAVEQLTAALTPHGLELDVPLLAARFAVPVKGDADGDGKPDAVAGVPTHAATGAPQLRVIEGGAGAAGADESVAAAPAQPADVAAGAQVASGTPAQDLALNGAQVTSLLDIVKGVANGELPRDAAIGIIKRAFLVSDAEADELLGSVGNGFVPTSQQPAAPAAPASQETAA
jgi:phage gp29-like protein